MDQVLKARKMSSASARRRRIQAREEEEVHAQERYIEHKRRVMLYDYRAEDNDSPSESGSNDGSEPSRHGREESVTTPSDCSVITPQETPSAPSVFEKTEAVPVEVTALPEKPQLHLLLPQTPVASSEPSTLIQPSPAPKLAASLVALSDFTYDRFSTIIDSPAQLLSPAETMSTPDLEFDDYSPSPVEIATPVSIRLPQTRPAVISISRSNKKRRTICAQSPLSQEGPSPSPPVPPTLPPRSERRLSQSSARSGFLASGAKLMEVPQLPANASAMIASASRESLAWSSNADVQKTMNRKSSQPLLAAIKTSHGRMSSIRSFIRSPTHNVTSSISSARPESRSSRPPTSTADVMNDAFPAFETVPANLHDPPAAVRPRPHTSHRPSRPSTSSTASRQASVTALPMVPPNFGNSSMNSEGQMAEPESGPMRRRKSFSALRKRSESIGQAIKLVATKTKGSAGHNPKLSHQLVSQQPHTVPLPPPPPQAPILVTTNSKSSIELSSFPTPPLPSPSVSVSTRSRKSVASYSMFPPSPRVGNERKSGVGLGLGLRV